MKRVYMTGGAPETAMECESGRGGSRVIFYILKKVESVL